MTTFGRAFSGTALGILAASLAFPFVGLFEPASGWKLGPAFYLAMMPFVLLFMPVFAGPGAFLLACVHPVKMEAWAPRARTLNQLRRVGVLLALPLGVANLALVFGVFSLFNGKLVVPVMELAPWLIPAIAGGAGLGWGVTFDLRPGNIVRRTRPPVLRHNGPPFFDNRASRRIRRTA